MAGDRDAFLARVRKAASRGRSWHVRTRDEFPRGLGYVGGGPDPAARLAAEIDAVGARAHRAASAEDARRIVAEIARDAHARLSVPTGPTPLPSGEGSGERHSRSSFHGAAIGTSNPTALCWEHPLLEQLGLTAVVEEAGFRMTPSAELATLDQTARKHELFAATLGLSGVDWAIAETGTLVVASGPGRPRSVSLLPPVHVAVLHQRQILPDLFDLFERLAEDQDSLPSSVVLITGPSKTGDIELKLTTGVHGPGEVHVVIVGET